MGLRPARLGTTATSCSGTRTAASTPATAARSTGDSAGCLASPSNTAGPAATRNATGTARACGAAKSPSATPATAKRARRKVSGTTKAAVVDKVRDLHNQLDQGTTPKAGYTRCTVRQAAENWLADGLDGRSPKTVKKNQNVLEPILTVIGARKLLSLLAGIRTEEARALRWEHVNLDGDPVATPPVPPHVAVWRSVRARRNQDRTVPPHPRPSRGGCPGAAFLVRQPGR
jgi:hypothetical protein